MADNLKKKLSLAGIKKYFDNKTGLLSKTNIDEKVGGFVSRGVQNVKQSFKDDPGQYSITRAFSGIQPAAKTVFEPIFGKQAAEDIGFGLRGATQLHPFQWANMATPGTKGGKQYYDNSATTQRQKTMETLGRSGYGMALTAPIGGSNYLKNIAGRAVKGTVLGAGMGIGGEQVSNLSKGEFKLPTREAAVKGAIGGLANSWQLALTDMATDKILSKVGLQKLVGSNTTNPFARQNFKEGVTRVFERALAEVPMENTFFTFIDKLSGDEKRDFLTAWAENIPGNILGNLAFAGVQTGFHSIKNLGPNEKKALQEGFEKAKSRLDPNLKLVEWEENGKKISEVFNKQDGADWTARLQDKGIEYKIRNLGSNAGFVRVGGAQDQKIKTQEAKNKQDFDESFKKVVSQQNVAKTIGTEKAMEIVKIPPEIAQDVIDYSEGVKTNVSPEAKEWAKKQKAIYKELYNELSQTAEKSGIEVGKVEDYMPHFWKETQEQIEAMPQYQNVLTGRGATKKRIVMDYKMGKELGLTPKYSHPVQIMEEYVKNLEEFKANTEFITDLKSKGILKTANQVKNLKGYSPIYAQGITKPGQVLYAPVAQAKEINALFMPQIQRGFEKGLEKTANFSKLVQEIKMSGGIPGTPINAFTAGQMIKSATGLQPVRTIQSFELAHNQGKSNQFFSEHVGTIKKIQSRDLGFNTSFKAENFIDKPKAEKMFGKSIGEAWGKLMNDPTFARFMPIEQIKAFEDIELKALNAGKSSEEAADIAAKAIKNFWGMDSVSGEMKKSKAGKDLVSTLFFAPKFRESMLGFWLNNIKALKDPLSLENIGNTKYMIGTALSLIGMNAANKALTGNNMWENPGGKKTTLLVPIDEEQTLGLPWAPSVGTLPRMGAKIVGKVSKGDFAGATLEAGTLLSSMLKPITDVLANKNYFGDNIVKETDTSEEKFKKQAEYLFKENVLAHPWLKQGYDIATKGFLDKPVYERLSKAMELPIRFYDTEDIKNSPFREKYDELKKLNARYEDLKYKDKTKALELLKDNEDKINEFQLMKTYLKEFWKQKDAGQTPTAMQDYMGGKKVKTSEASTDFIGSRISLGDETLTGEELSRYYLRDLETKPTSKYEQVKREKDIYKRLSTINNSEKLTDQQKADTINSLVGEVGITKQDYDYYQVANESVDARSAYIQDKLESGELNNREDFIKFLVENRQEVNGKTIATEPVLKDLYEQGLISKDEYTKLKNFKYGKDASGKVTPKVKLTGRGSGAKLKSISIADYLPTSLPSASKIKAAKVQKITKTQPTSFSKNQIKTTDLNLANYTGKPAQAIARIKARPINL